MIETENQLPQEHRRADACVMVIFGATGDLTKRKLLPALYNLARQNFLPEEFSFVGAARQEMSEADFRQKIGDDLREFVSGEKDEKLIEWFQKRAFFVQGNYDDAQTFEKLKSKLSEIDGEFTDEG